VREVAALLDRNRLVTVTGPGGSGKTRLAGEVANQVAGRFADAVWLAELAPVRDPVWVPSVAMAALGVREQPGLPAAEVLARVLARQQLLLVLDNCEHVLDAAVELCAGLLTACDDVRVLATSREPLRIAGEARYRPAALTLPGPGDPAEEAAGCEAVALFVDRARQADMNFMPDERTGPAVARLVTRLDGMPLAIELAAARVEALGVTQLLDRLDDRFALLAGADRLAAAPSRARHLVPADPDLDGIHRSGPGRQAGPDRVRDQRLPGPLLRLRPVRAAVDLALPRRVPGAQTAGPAARDLSSHPRHPLLPWLLLHGR
jgi:predicted ATPase